MDKVFSKIRDIYDDMFYLKTLSRNQDVWSITKYLTKYLTKQKSDPRLWKHKRYFTSRDIKQPTVMRDELANHLICEGFLSMYLRRAHTFNIEYCGDVEYTEYYLGHKGSLKPQLLDEYSRNQLELARKEKRS